MHCWYNSAEHGVIRAVELLRVLSLEGEPSVRSIPLLSYSFSDPSDDEERRGDAFWWAL